MTNDTFIRLEHNFPASSEAVFDAWVNPEIAKQWFFKSDTNEIRSLTMDARKGGSFSVLECNDGLEIDHWGTYLEVVRSRRLSFTLEVPKHIQGVAKVDISIIDIDNNNCLLVFEESGIDIAKVEKNWIDMLSRLEAVLKSLS